MVEDKTTTGGIMDSNDLVKFSEIMMALAEVFESDGEPSSVKIELYFNAFKDKSIEQITEATGKLLKTRKFSSFPKPAEILVLIDGDAGDGALLAWGSIMKGLEIDEMPTDPKSQEIIRRIGGWIWLGLQTYDELKWVEKRFVEHWDACPDESILKLEDGRVAELLENIGMNLIKRPF